MGRSTTSPRVCNIQLEVRSTQVLSISQVLSKISAIRSRNSNNKHITPTSDETKPSANNPTLRLWEWHKKYLTNVKVYASFLVQNLIVYQETCQSVLPADSTHNGFTTPTRPNLSSCPKSKIIMGAIRMQWICMSARIFIQRRVSDMLPKTQFLNNEM